MIRVAILASTSTLRYGLRSILTSASVLSDSHSESEVAFESGSIIEFLQANPQVDVLLLDSELIDQPSLARIAASQEGQLGIIVLTGDPAPARILKQLPLRGWGLIPMDVSVDELQAAVQAVAEGLLVGAPELLAPLLSDSLISVSTEMGQPHETLTSRELQILQLLALGLANKQIAQKLAISEHTVKFHISSIYTKLGVASRTEAVRSGMQRGLITL